MLALIEKNDKKYKLKKGERKNGWTWRFLWITLAEGANVTLGSYLPEFGLTYLKKNMSVMGFTDTQAAVPSHPREVGPWLLSHLLSGEKDQGKSTRIWTLFLHLIYLMYFPSVPPFHHQATSDYYLTLPPDLSTEGECDGLTQHFISPSDTSGPRCKFMYLRLGVGM